MPRGRAGHYARPGVLGRDFSDRPLERFPAADGFLRDPEKQTLMVAISQLPVSDGLSTPWPVVMAGIAIATVPLLVAFVILQKYDIADLMAGSTKG